MVRTATELKDQYKKERRIKEYKDDFLHPGASGGIRKRRYHVMDTERCDESIRTDQETDRRTEARDKETTDIAERVDAGESLTKAQIEAVEKNPAVRILVKKKLNELGFTTDQMYAEALVAGFQASQGTEKDADGKLVPIAQRDRFQNRKLVLDQIKDLDGLKAEPEALKPKDQTINIIVHPDLAMKIDNVNRNIEIHPGSTSPGDATSDAARSSHQNSGVWEEKRENVRGDG
jgi:hypothetical protein